LTKGRKHPGYYYAMRDEILVRMDDRAGHPFDATNYRKQFRIVASKHKIFPGSDGYGAHFRIIMGMVSGKLIKAKPRQVVLG
jgi:hypothetical protein